MSSSSSWIDRSVAAVVRIDRSIARATRPGSAFDRAVASGAARVGGGIHAAWERILAASSRNARIARWLARARAAFAAPKRGVLAVLRAAAADPSGVIGAATLAVVAWVLVTTFWDVLAIPPRLISGAISAVTPTTCAAFGKGAVSESLCGLSLGVLTVLGALVAMVIGVLLRVPLRRILAAILAWLPREASFMGPPLLATVLFTMGWAGVQYHVPERPGLVSDGLFPVVFALATYALARGWPVVSGRLRGPLAWRDHLDRRALTVGVVGAPIVVAIVATPALNPPVRDQLVALVGLIVGYVLLAPAAIGRSSLGAGGPRTSATALATVTGGAFWLALGGLADAAGPCAGAFVLDAQACEAAHHGPVVAVAGAAIAGLAGLVGALATEAGPSAAPAVEDVRPRGSSFTSEPALAETIATRMTDLANLQSLYDQNIKAGKTPAEAMGLAIAQQVAGMAGGDAFGGIADPRGSIAGGMLMGSTMSGALDPGSVAANFVGTGYDALKALYETVRASVDAGEEHGDAFDRVAERVRDRPGADPLAGWGQAADLLGEEWARSEGNALEDAQRMWETGALGDQVNESLETFRARVQRGDEGGALQGLNELMAIAADAYEDPQATADYALGQLSQDIRRISETSYDAAFWQDVAERNQAVADSVPLLGTVGRGYGEIAAGIGDEGVSGFASEMAEGAGELKREAAHALAETAVRAAEATRNYLRSLFGGS